MPFRDTRANSNFGKVPSEDLASPEDNLTLWQFLTVSWMWPMISIGKTRILNENDVWQLSYQFQHQRLHEKFQRMKGSVLGRLCRANIIDFFIISFLALFTLIAGMSCTVNSPPETDSLPEYSLPLLLQQLLSSMENPISTKNAVLTYAILSLVARAASAQLSVLSIWFGRRCYERSRGELIMMVYSKTLSRKNVTSSVTSDKDTPEETGDLAAVPQEPRFKRLLAWLNPFRRNNLKEQKKQHASMGKILNVVRGDIYDVAQRFWEIDQLIKIPLGIVFSATLIWKLLGPSCFLGLVALLISQLLNYWLIKWSIKLGKTLKTARDKRIQSTGQFIEVIRHLRWYGWQDHWLNQVQDNRIVELNIRFKNAMVNVLMTFLNAVSRCMFPVIALYSYTYLAGHELRVDLIFPALSLFSSLDSRLTDVPDFITTLINAHIAMGRINTIMDEPELEKMPVTNQDNELRLNITKGSFAWPEQQEPVLKDLNLDFRPGLTLVTGKVGAGKTALLQCLLGELDELEGTKSLANEAIGYCAQTAWLQSMTIRDNILFFAPYDEIRYRKVVDACELSQDFASFAHGDLSNIGENGIGLSGGQKARVALARAIYNHSRILLLDDPLSALDYQTAQSIVRKLFKSPMLEGRIVILVTHRVDLVQEIATQIIEVRDGKATPTSMQQLRPDAMEDDSARTADKHDEPDESTKGVAEKFMEDEHRAEWGVQARVYWTYIKAGTMPYWTLDLIALTSTRVVSFAYTWFIKAWGEAYGTTTSIRSQIYHQSTNMTTSSSSIGFRLLYDFDLPSVTQSSLYGIHPSISTWSFKWPRSNSLPRPEDDVRPWLWAFFAISMIQATVYLFWWLCDVLIIFTAAKHLFQQVMGRVTYATFRFYDVTPIGRLMNRMTSDISVVDGKISQHFGRIALQIVTWVSSVVIIASITPTFLLFSVVLMMIYVYIFSQFLPTSQSLRRLETVSLSPLFANFGELLQGLTTVRAFHAGEQFQRRIISVVDKFQGMDHFFWSLQSWVSYRFELLSALSTFALTVLAVYLRLSPGLTAFTLSIANMFVNSTHFLCRRYGELQMEFVSVERIEELLHIDQEPQGIVDPPAIWPRFGEPIVLTDLCVRYAAHLDLALNNINLTIPGGSTVALVGRTGSGKSTLAQALLGAVRPDSGDISIDGISINDVKIDTLRHRVTFVAQDPVLFTGTIRHNLDPLEQFSDEECAAVLERICHRQGWTLSSKIEPGGRNISQGQRQLIGITRAVLRRSPVVILDEATASIDVETSMEIQQILREEMQQSTVITIAHRVEAVKDADYAIVLDHGKVLRHGPASEILVS